jgi:hypothetical protein
MMVPEKDLLWQKSTRSGDASNCVEVVAVEDVQDK